MSRLDLANRRRAAAESLLHVVTGHHVEWERFARRRAFRRRVRRVATVIGLIAVAMLVGRLLSWAWGGT